MGPIRIKDGERAACNESRQNTPMPLPRELNMHSASPLISESPPPPPPVSLLCACGVLWSVDRVHAFRASPSLAPSVPPSLVIQASYRAQNSPDSWHIVRLDAGICCCQPP